MRNFYLPIFLVGTLVLITSCKKNYSNIPDVDKGDFMNDTKAFFYSNVKWKSNNKENAVGDVLNPSAIYSREPIWPLASTTKLSGRNVLSVPLKYDSLFYVSSSASNNRLYLISEVSRLCMYKDSSNRFHAEVITLVPDHTYFANNKKSFSGIIHVDAWDGSPLHSYLFNGSGATPTIRSKAGSISTLSRSENSVTENSIAVLETCYYFEGYNYSPAYDGGYYYEEELGCNYEILDLGGGDGGGGLGSGGYLGAVTGGGGGSAVSINPLTNKPVVGGNNIIGNIKDYDKCFTNVAGTTNSYAVTLCVDQPVPGSRDPWGFTVTGSSSGSNLVNVGHAFLIFTESGPNGTVQRNVGFYPSDYVTPISPSDQGQLNNDNSHSYNISLTVKLDNSQFFNMLNYVSGGNSQSYNLNTNNCTSFVLHTLAAGDVDILSQQGKWAGGGGYDPGDLGEDIRSMTLQTGMTKSTSDPAHPNLGTCN
ncbi:MAG TPA: hypothetical protein VMT76_01730 [Puia sp.]|nr:hypothetical protein [Puia sp.]